MRDYRDRKAAGLDTLVDSKLHSRRFDPRTGIEVEALVRDINIDGLAAQKARLQCEISDIDALIADIHKMEGTA